jgi:hypothetical protein
MCGILDTNRFSAALRNPVDSELAPFLSWILERDGQLVFGGSVYSREVDRHDAARRFFATLLRAGKVTRIDAKLVDLEQDQVSDSCASNDSHLIALARVTGARLFCTDDTKLMLDVRTKHLLDNPRGRIYQRRNHAHLLRHDANCPHPPKKRSKLPKKKR